MTSSRVFQQLILARGANMEANSINGNTSLALAQSRGHKSIIRLLQDAGDVNLILPQVQAYNTINRIVVECRT